MTALGSATAIVLLVLAGVFLGILPDVVQWARTGDATYIADMDGMLYLAWSRAATLRNEPRLVDAVLDPSGPSQHPRLVFVPPALLAHNLGLDSTGLGLVWRSLSGAALALGLYIALRPATRRRWVALILSLILLYDCGLIFGQVIQRDIQMLVDLLGGEARYLAGVPQIMAHLRAPIPSLPLALLLAHYGLALRARLRGGFWATAGAAVSFGLLFHAYFYFWTAVTLGLIAALVLDPQGRRLYATTLLVGLAIGLPAILNGIHIKSSTPADWLHRTYKFIPFGRTENLLIPKVLVAEWLLVGLLVPRRRELTYLWCCVGAGLACTNHQLVTRMDIENFHWQQFTGATFSLILALLAVWYLFDPPPVEGDQGPGSARAAWRRSMLFVLIALMLPLGIWFRIQESLHTRQTREVMAVYASIRDDGVVIPGGAVVGGDPLGTFMAALLGEVYPLSGRLVSFAAPVKDTEVDERLLLNLYLVGASREEARRRVADPIGLFGAWEAFVLRPDVARERIRSRTTLVDPVWDDPRGFLERYGVTHVLLPADAPTAHLDGQARRVHEGPSWQLWKINPIDRGA